jgi:hypothetical protein
MQQISNFSKSHQQACRKKEPIVRSGGFAPRDNVANQQEKGVCCVVVASGKDRYARPCRALQETRVHRESDLRRSYRTPLAVDTLHTSCCTIDSDGRRTFDPDERVRSRLETFSPVNPAAFPCHKYVAPDPPFVIESHKMLVFRPVRDLHYLHRTSNLVSHPGTS